MKFLNLVVLFFFLNVIALASFSKTQDACIAFKQASCDFSTQPFVVCDKYLFLKVTYSLLEYESVAEHLGKELSAIRSALSAFILPPLPNYEDSPFCEALTSWMMPKYTYNFSNLASCVVQDETLDNDVRVKVFAFDLPQVLRVKNEVASQKVDFKKRSEREWISALCETSRHFNKTDEEKKIFYILLGCPIVNVIEDKLGRGLYGKDFVETNPVYTPVSEEVDAILTHIKGDAGFFAENKTLLWATSEQKKALFYFPREIETKKMEKAKSLYRRGKDLPQIIKLLSESIAEDPINAEKWKYMGGALYVKGDYMDAIVAYVQSLRLNQQDNEAWKGLLNACQKAQLSRHAEGLKWYLLMKENATLTP